MCGIFGIINKDFSPINFEKLKEGNNKAAHRGPDAEDYYIQNNIGFGHRRLSIIDIDPRSNQPFIFDDLVLVFNGEIFNYIELREELIRLGHTFNTESDTEVLIKAYKEWGVDCQQRFIGMWAFVIYDRTKNILLISRDRFGIKPLYYYNSGNQFIFSSEIKQILSQDIPAIANKKVLANYLICSITHYSKETFFDNIFILEPCKYFILDLEKFELAEFQYFDFTENVKILEKDKKKNFDKFYELIYASIEKRLRSDVPIATSLSGGLDSSFISSCAAKILNGKTEFRAFNLKSNQEDNDESHYAKELADFANLDLTHITVNKTEFDKELNKVIWSQEEPFLGTSVVFQYFLFKKIKEFNFKVVLDGQGADELLLGYKRYMIFIFKNSSLRHKLHLLFNLRNSDISPFEFFKYWIYFGFYWARNSFTKWSNSYIKKDFLNNYDSNLISNFSNYFNSPKSFRINQFNSFPLTAYLNYEDKNSMANSIESRVPFLDFPLANYIISLDLSYLNFNGFSKYCLRKKGYEEGILPENITWRKNKIGLEPPNKLWLNNKDYYKNDLLSSEFLNQFINFKKFDWREEKPFWKILNIYLWSNLYNVKYPNS